MLDDKKLEELRRRVARLIQEGAISKEGKKEYVGFFLENAEKSLRSAQLLYAVSTKQDLQAATGFLEHDASLHARRRERVQGPAEPV